MAVAVLCWRDTVQSIDFLLRLHARRKVLFAAKIDLIIRPSRCIFSSVCPCRVTSGLPTYNLLSTGKCRQACSAVWAQLAPLPSTACSFTEHMLLKPVLANRERT
jgi:hypothetical protein